MAKQIQLQSKQISKVLDGGQDALVSIFNKRKEVEKEKDLFDLPKLVKNEDDDDSSDSDREDLLQRLSIDAKTDIHQVDLESDEFKSLTSHSKALVLMELRERRKQSSWAKLGEMPKSANEFSGFQLERLKKRSAMHKTLDEVGAEVTDLGASLLDQKLFVGDKKGMKKEKMEQKQKAARIVGQDFAYFAYEPNEDEEQNPRPGTSKENHDIKSTNSDDVSQEEIMAIVKDGLAETEDILLIEPTTEVSKHSSRRGGVGAEVKTEVLNQFKEVEMSESSEDENVEPVAEGSDSDDSDDFVEVSEGENENQEDQESLKDKDNSNEDEDIFADVFTSVESHKALDDIIKSTMNKKCDEVVNEPQKSQFQEEESRSSNSQEFNSNRKRKVDDKSDNKNEKDDSKKQKLASVKLDIASKMKEKNSLFLKIASKWAEDSAEKDVGKEKVNKSKSFQKSRNNVEKTAQTKMEEELQKETESLVREMKEKQSKERLLRAKESTFESEKSISVVSKAKKSKLGSEEISLLTDLDVNVQDKEEYNQSIVENNSLDKSVVYGSSAPGFVRSKKNQDVVEVKTETLSDDEETPQLNEMEESILHKLNTETEDEETVLSKEELLQIQERLAQDQNQLIAECAKQDRMATSVSDQMYLDCQELLQMFGLPWIVSPGEAEAECAFLDMNNLSNGTITEDSDIWVFGGQRVYKNFFNQDKHCEAFSAADVAKHFGLSREKMILVALLTGSDYTDGIESVGPVTAMEILAEFPGVGLEPLREFKTWWDLHHGEKSLPPGSRQREKLRKLKLPESKSLFKQILYFSFL